MHIKWIKNPNYATTSILYVSIGDVLADSIDNSINEDSLAALIRMPGGCVEQNLASITLPLIAAHYLDRSAQWDSVGINRREEAIKYIQRGEMRVTRFLFFLDKTIY